MPDGSGSAPALCRLDAVSLARGGLRLLDRLDFSVPDAPGVTALMGPNGAGKSLTLRLIAGLIAPDAGRVGLGCAPREVALVLQRPVLLRRSVRANLDHALGLAGVTRRARRDRLDHALALGRLEALAERPARALSGGEQSRLALVRALLVRPRLLLLDEPTAHLDPQATAMIEAIVRDAVGQGTHAVLVTHDRGQAGRLASRVAFLARGRLAETTPAARFLARPASEEGRAYLDGRLIL